VHPPRGPPVLGWTALRLPRGCALQASEMKRRVLPSRSREVTCHVKENGPSSLLLGRPLVWPYGYSPPSTVAWRATRC
jgi:hypothetical protein